jgi:hypothetical protein
MSRRIRTAAGAGAEGDARPPTSSRRAVPVVVAAICFLLGFTGRGLVESFVVFLLPLSTEFGLDRASAVSIYALSVLGTGIGGPVVGACSTERGRAPSTPPALR